MKPNFLIIGTQKGGTTSAIRHLSQHQDITIHRGEYLNGETHFFNSDKSIDEYKNLFKKYNTKWVGEKTPKYMVIPRAMNKIYRFNPDMKLLIFLREPVSRLYSQWNMMLKGNKLSKKFTNFLTYANLNKDRSLIRGYYINQIDRILKKFPRENIHISISEQIKNNPLEGYNRIFHFFNLKPLEEINFNPGIHKKNYNRPINDKEFKHLYEIYKPYNERLYDFLGYQINEWEEVYKARGL